MTGKLQQRPSFLVSNELAERIVNFIVKSLEQKKHPDGGWGILDDMQKAKDANHSGGGPVPVRIVGNCKGKYTPKTDPCYHCPAVEVCPIEQDEINQVKHDVAIARATIEKVMKDWDSTNLIGNPETRYGELRRKKWDWRSFYNGWVEGRANMLESLRSGGQKKGEEGKNGLQTGV